MTEPPLPSLPASSKRERRLRIMWICLAGFNIVMLIVTVPPLIRGDTDVYFHQHARLVASALAGLLICSTSLARGWLQGALMTTSWAAIVGVFWLAIR